MSQTQLSIPLIGQKSTAWWFYWRVLKFHLFLVRDWDENKLGQMFLEYFVWFRFGPNPWNINHQNLKSGTLIVSCHEMIYDISNQTILQNFLWFYIGLIKKIETWYCSLYVNILYIKSKIKKSRSVTKNKNAKRWQLSNN